MSENLHDIDRLFKEAFERHFEMPSPGAWQAINEGLNKTQIERISKRYSWLRRASFFAMLILLSIRIHDLRPEFRSNDFLAKASNEYTGQSNKGSNLKDRALQNYIPPGSRKIDVEKSALMSNASNGTEDLDGELRNGKGLMSYNSPTESVIILPETRPGYSMRDDPLDLASLRRNGVIVADQDKKASGHDQLASQKRSRLSAIVFFSPDFPFYRLQNDPPDNQSGNEIREGEKPDLSSTTGVLLDYRLNDHWTLESGLSYSNSIILIDPKTIYAEKDNTGSVKYRYNASSGYGYTLPSFSVSPNVGDSLYTFTSTHTLRYLNVPVAARYNVQRGKFSFFGTAGVSTNILLQGIIETLVQDNSNNEVEVMNHLHGLKKIYFSGSFGIGAEYRLTKNLSLLVSPTRRFAINSINKNVAVKSYPNSFGIVTGVRMDF